MRLIAVVFLVAGCGSGSGTHCDPCAPDGEALDLSLGAADLSLADAAVAADQSLPPDFAGPDFYGFALCANTPVASTCAQIFFQSVGDCFLSLFGNCTTGDDGMGDVDYCWANGDKLLTVANPNDGSLHQTWMAGPKSCLTGDVKSMKGGGTVFVLSDGKSTLTYDEKSGAVTCPDGSAANIGANEGGCPALVDLLQPPRKICAAGICT